MALPRPPLDSVPYWWGRLIALYARWAIKPDRILVEGGENAPEEAAIAATWHGNDMIGMRLFPLVRGRPYVGFVPPGIVGAAMRGWFDGAGCSDVVPLPDVGHGNVSGALRAMTRHLKSGRDVVVALDGPKGPANVVRPGAPWIARATGARLVVFGADARPAWRWPRWDRLTMPLPGARVTAVLGQPLSVPAGADLEAVSGQVDAALRAAQARATALLDLPWPAPTGRVLAQVSPSASGEHA
jgi:lysophospholipid acyltransferase (LPLAT)-like uncharacterized protein